MHLEYFGVAVQSSAGAAAFDVKIARSGKVYLVPADKTVIAVLTENGIDIPLACEQGVCGTCITRILDGVPEHHDVYFTDEERAANDQFTPCCSRSKSAVLVLDI